MAYERLSTKKERGESLDSFIENISTVLSNQMKVRNASEESNFNKLVLENNISLESQLDYRKEQLKRVSDDPVERKRIRDEISNLKDRIEQKQFTDQYIEKLISYESGISSIDSVIDWLNTAKSSATDQGIIDTINKQLTEKQSQRYNIVKQTIENQTKYAVEDKSGSLIDSQITKVENERNKALFAGDQSLVSVYDLQLQTLKKAKNENQIQKDITSFAVSAVSGFTTATALLDSYNSKIASAAADGPVTIGGTTYNSAREYWSYQRDTYLADSSSKGFFSQFSSEVKNKIATENSKNNLSAGSLQEITGRFDTLASRPELAPYKEQIGIYKQDSMQTGANYISDKVINDYAVDYDINKALGGLNSLKTLGVNVSDSITKVMTTGAQIKTGQVSNILSVANDLVATGLSPEEAVAQAISQGAGATVSPEQAVNKSEGTIAKDFAQGFQTKSFTQDPRTTATPVTNTNTPSVTQPTSQPQQQPTATLNTYQYVDRSGQLKTIQAANPTEALSKATDKASNSGVSLMNSGSSPANITPSTPVKSNTTTTTTTTSPTPVPVSTPTPTKPTPSGYIQVNGAYFEQSASGPKAVMDNDIIKQLNSGQLSYTKKTSLFN